MGLLCNGSRQEKKLLCLWGIWAYGLSLQKPGKRKSNRREKSRIWRRKVRG